MPIDVEGVLISSGGTGFGVTGVTFVTLPPARTLRAGPDGLARACAVIPRPSVEVDVPRDQRAGPANAVSVTSSPSAARVLPLGWPKLCIVPHSDLGMMGVFEVVPPGADPADTLRLACRL
jgi:hypothetical protein